MDWLVGEGGGRGGRPGKNGRVVYENRDQEEEELSTELSVEEGKKTRGSESGGKLEREGRKEADE